MEHSTLISVIIPAYNAEKYLAQCIDNVLFQTYKNLEIIVVNDGSTDNTAQIAQDYTMVKYIYQANRGLSAARNSGMNAAIGEYIHFLDVDDLLTLDFYEKMIEAAVETQADMACCGFYFERIPSLTQRIEYKTVVSATEDKISMTNVCSYGSCWRYICKLSFLKKHKLYFEIGRLAEDRIFSIQAVYFANRIVLVPDVMYIYKYRKNAITTTKDIAFVKKRHADRRYANRFQIDFAKQHGFSLDKNLDRRRWEYKLFGLPIVTKVVYHAGKTRWFLLGIPVFQKKEIDK